MPVRIKTAIVYTVGSCSVFTQTSEECSLPARCLRTSYIQYKVFLNHDLEYRNLKKSLFHLLFMYTLGNGDNFIANSSALK